MSEQLDLPVRQAGKFSNPLIVFTLMVHAHRCIFRYCITTRLLENSNVFYLKHGKIGSRQRELAIINCIWNHALNKEERKKSGWLFSGCSPLSLVNNGLWETRLVHDDGTLGPRRLFYIVLIKLMFLNIIIGRKHIVTWKCWFEWAISKIGSWILAGPNITLQLLWLLGKRFLKQYLSGFWQFRRCDLDHLGEPSR